MFDSASHGPFGGGPVCSSGKAPFPKASRSPAASRYCFSHVGGAPAGCHARLGSLEWERKMSSLDKQACTRAAKHWLVFGLTLSLLEGTSWETIFLWCPQANRKLTILWVSLF